MLCTRRELIGSQFATETIRKGDGEEQGIARPKSVARIKE
jgi:hypothetical protein